MSATSVVRKLEETETTRRQIRTLLEEGPYTAKEISSAVHRSEKEVENHLEHLRKSLRSEGRQLDLILPSAEGAGSCSGNGTGSRRRPDVPSAREKRSPTRLFAWQAVKTEIHESKSYRKPGGNRRNRVRWFDDVDWWLNVDPEFGAVGHLL